MKKHYLKCPPLSGNSTVSTNAVTRVGSNCGVGIPRSQCAQTCAAPNMTAVTGSPAHMCTRGAWTGRTLACGMMCPRLPRPETATGCSRVMQWEPFSVGDLYNDTTGIVQRPPRYTGGMMSSTLARYSVFPAVPDGVQSDLFQIVPAESVGSVLSATDVTLTSYDRTGAYDPVAVWRAKDELVAAGAPVKLGNFTTDRTYSGLLHASSLKTPNESPYMGGYVLTHTSPAWVSDSVNNPSQSSYWYSARIRPVTDMAGVAFRFSTGAVLPGGADNWMVGSGTSYYVAAIDAEASDARRDVDPVVRLWKVVNGITTHLDGRTWSIVRRDGGGLEINRGRWYTLSARVSQYGIAVWVTDDATGNGTQVFVSPDTSLPVGGMGAFIAGTAQFDDLRVNSSCALDGSASGLASNYATGIGSMVQHMCPPGYLSTGSKLRVCQDDGSWSGTPLVCAPPPPAWVRSTLTGDGMGLGFPFVWFNRTTSEASPANTLIGNPIAAIPAGGTTTPLDVLYKIPTATELGYDNGNVDNATGLTLFSIDTCGGQVRVRNNVFDWYVQRRYNITVWAYVIGEAGAIGFVQGSVIINLTPVNRPPQFRDIVVTVNEGVPAGTLVGVGAAPNNGPLTAYDREGTPAVFSIISGNELGLFTIGPNPPLVPGTTPSGQLAVAAGVNAGLYPGTRFCGCGANVLNFEGPQKVFTLTVRAADGRDSTLYTQGSVRIVINDTNDQPVQSDNQMRTIMDTSAQAGSSVGSPLTAFDEDVGDTLSWSIVQTWGGPGADGGANMPIVVFPLPFSIVGATGQLILQNPPAINVGATPRVVQGYATRAAYRISVRVTDSAGASDTKNQTVLILANITSGGVQGTVTGFSAPVGGLSTAGGETIEITGDFLPLPPAAQQVYTEYSRGPGFTVYRAPCTVRVPVSGVTEPSMSMNCTTVPGVGSGLEFNFFYVNAANATVSIPTSGTAQTLASYAKPAISFLVAPSNSTSTNNTLTVRIARRLLIDLRASDYNPSQNLWDNRATTGELEESRFSAAIFVRLVRVYIVYRRPLLTQGTF